jgi:hypothetical protein
MKRESGIHINRTDMITILKGIMPNGVDCIKMSKEIFKRAKSKSLTTRLLIIDTKKLEQSAKRVSSSSITDADLFANILLNTRRALKHRGIQQIKPTSRDWLVLKEVVELANEFVDCRDFHSKREGYIQYIKIGLGKMTTYNLSKFKTLATYILDYHSAQLELLEDCQKQQTDLAYEYYNARVLERTGISMGLENDPIKMVFFKRVAEQCHKLKVKPQTYIKAQFAGLEYKDGLPEPSQLVGERAIQRLSKYLYENSEKPVVSNKVGLKNLKNL